MSSNRSDHQTISWGECSQHGQWSQVFLSAGQEVANPMCPKCREEAEVRALLRRAAIPPRFVHCSFSSFRAGSPEQQAALAACQGYSEDFQRMYPQGVCLVLRGAPGTGKNHLATAISRAVCEKGYTSCLLTVAELIARVRATWSRDSDEAQDEVIRRFVAVDLLILDEVGRQNGSESEKLTLFQLIDGRYRFMRPTILITNLRTEEISNYIGEAAYDRLREGGGRLINFDWTSYRR